MTSLGKIEEFNPSQTNIARYLERLEQYFEANDVPEDSQESKKHRAILISVIHLHPKVHVTPFLQPCTNWVQIDTV